MAQKFLDSITFTLNLAEEKENTALLNNEKNSIPKNNDEKEEGEDKRRSNDKIFNFSTHPIVETKRRKGTWNIGEIKNSNDHLEWENNFHHKRILISSQKVKKSTRSGLVIILLF